MLNVRGARNLPCETRPGKRAPTVKMCESDETYVPLNDGYNWKGDPNRTYSGQAIRSSDQEMSRRGSPHHRRHRVRNRPRSRPSNMTQPPACTWTRWAYVQPRRPGSWSYKGENVAEHADASQEELSEAEGLADDADHADDVAEATRRRYRG